jgi:hypothetical protein
MGLGQRSHTFLLKGARMLNDVSLPAGLLTSLLHICCFMETKSGDPEDYRVQGNSQGASVSCIRQSSLVITSNGR